MASNFKDLGVSGLTRFGGLIYQEWLNELRGTKGVRVYKEMRDNDPVVGSFLYAVEMLMRQTKYRIESQGEELEDEEAKKFIEDCFVSMEQTWSEIMSSIVSMLPFGWALLEVTLKKREDGRIGWKSWGHRSQDTLYKWGYDKDNNVETFYQLAPPNYKITEIPMKKCLLFKVYNALESPEGRSILRNAYRPWYFKKNIEEIEGIGIERDLAGLPVAWIPAEIIADGGAEYNEWKKIVSNIKRDEQEGMVMPMVYDDAGNKMYDFGLLTTGSRRQFDTNQIITRYEQRMAMTVLADFIMLGHGNVGSFALSSDKTKLFAVALGAILKSIEDVINRKAIPNLIKINDFNIDKPPVFRFNDIESPDLDVLGRFVQTLSGAGFPLFDNRELENVLMESANLPVRQDIDITDTESETLNEDKDEDMEVSEKEKNSVDKSYYNRKFDELLKKINKG